jgi:PHD/YefM family antitoxin component YafN of YafNO toxin-antitoxin module
MPRRIRLDADTDLVSLVEDVHADRAPRVLERDGEDVAVILSPDDYADLTGEPKSKRNKERLLALAGVWKDENAPALIEEIYRRRHDAPSSPPVTL